MKQVAIFASGAGSNARKLIDHFRNSPAVRIALVVCNKPGAGVIRIAEENKIPCLLIGKGDIGEGQKLQQKLESHHISFIVLAGYLWLIPAWMVKKYPSSIVNIHPALLPRHGGKGMYGSRVHEAVIAAGEKESGITIHFVNEHYDEGLTIFQATCEVHRDDTPESLAEKIHRLEHEHYPNIVEDLLKKQG